MSIWILLFMHKNILAIEKKGITSKIYDLTGLFSLNTLAGNARTGQKKDLDELLDFIID